jgi:hypothetical protein
MLLTWEESLFFCTAAAAEEAPEAPASLLNG